jgi:hypothetical protein
MDKLRKILEERIQRLEDEFIQECARDDRGSDMVKYGMGYAIGALQAVYIEAYAAPFKVVKR